MALATLFYIMSRYTVEGTIHFLFVRSDPKIAKGDYKLRPVRPLGTTGPPMKFDV